MIIIMGTEIEGVEDFNIGKPKALTTSGVQLSGRIDF